MNENQNAYFNISMQSNAQHSNQGRQAGKARQRDIPTAHKKFIANSKSKDIISYHHIAKPNKHQEKKKKKKIQPASSPVITSPDPQPLHFMVIPRPSPPFTHAQSDYSTPHPQTPSSHPSYPRPLAPLAPLAPLPPPAPSPRAPPPPPTPSAPPPAGPAPCDTRASTD